METQKPTEEIPISLAIVSIVAVVLLQFPMVQTKVTALLNFVSKFFH